MKYLFIILFIFLNSNIINSVPNIKYKYKVEIYIGFSLIGYSHKNCSYDFTDFIQRNSGDIQLVVDDFLIYNQIYYIKDSVNITSSKNDSIIKNECKDIFILTNKDNKIDTIGIKINSPYISINGIRYFDENKSILNNLISFLPCIVVKRLGKRCE